MKHTLKKRTDLNGNHQTPNFLNPEHVLSIDDQVRSECWGQYVDYPFSRTISEKISQFPLYNLICILYLRMNSYKHFICNEKYDCTYNYIYCTYKTHRQT